MGRIRKRKECLRKIFRSKKGVPQKNKKKLELSTPEEQDQGIIEYLRRAGRSK